MRAVVFDLFGTLVGNFSVREHQDVIARMAAALGVPVAAFDRLWNHGTWEGRATGRFPDLEASIAHVCGEMEVPPDADRIAEAARIRLDFTRRALAPSPETLETLDRLRERGYRLGMITDCSVEVPTLWPGTPMAARIEAPVFSCAAGATKPDPRLYRTVCDRLGVEPGECLYVGDGSGRELTGALRAGMHPVLLRVPLADTYDASRPDVAEWSGPSIARLSEVLRLLA